MCDTRLPYHGKVAVLAVDDTEEARFKSYLACELMPRVIRRHPDATPVILRLKAAGSAAIGRAICNWAHAKDTALIVMARHSRSAFEEFFVGSVSSFCVSNCREPLMLLP
ncbi:hypothetical protein WJX72_006974 [[Myrmecia] bisecta]|uniref:UspA domain-containing protein n=1 Tax=[Myrmecia] bisecta TaxID=41462 RepID=A0AAW1PKI7_9CHLO